MLIHCLVGAHRAGTTGIAFLMHAEGLDLLTAAAAAAGCRSIIEPIGGFPALLARLESALNSARTASALES